jgi:ribosomal protein S18 acetylase RimI-like enzyme
MDPPVSAEPAQGTGVRPARSDDHAALRGLFEDLDRLHRIARPELFRAADGPARASAFLDQMIAGPDSTLLVAEHDGGLSGLVIVQLRDIAGLPIIVPHRVALIDSLVVREDRRQRGVGRALVGAAERWGRARGAAAVEIVVHHFNIAAWRFYEAIGYRASTVRLRRDLAAAPAAMRI